MAENRSAVQDSFSLELLLRFVEKVPKCEALQIFKEKLNEMSSDEREVHLIGIFTVYRKIMQTPRSPRTSQEMLEQLVDFLRIMLADGGDASLCDFLLGWFWVSYDSEYDWEYILSRVSGESWWYIQDSTQLMREIMFSTPYSMFLLKYGYPYSFERSYFNMLCVRCHLKGFPEDVFQFMRGSQGSLRLQMALQILVAVFPNNGFMKWDREILSLMWKTVPHPFISSTEMFQLMAPFFVDYPQKLQDLCEEYPKCNNLFAVPEVTSPRSLLHLSRVRVRKNLLDVRRLNDGMIENLNIPNSLKGYLKLDSL